MQKWPKYVAHMHRLWKVFESGVKTMASADCEPITWVWGWSPQRSPRAEGEAPPEAEMLLDVQWKWCDKYAYFSEI